VKPSATHFKAFTGPSNRAKMVGVGRLLPPEFSPETGASLSKTQISNRYLLVAAQL